MRKRKIYGYLSTIILVSIVIVTALFNLRDNSIDVNAVKDNLMYVHFLDVGQGDCSIICLPTGENILVDAGPGLSKEKVTDYISSCGVNKIDLFIMSHPHEDHIGGAVSVFDAFEVKEVLMPDAVSSSILFGDVMDAAEKEGCETVKAFPSQSFTVGEAKLYILAPETCDEDNLNNSSIVFKLTYGNNSFMFTGDAEKEEENTVTDSFDSDILKSDVLKVGHHGSYTSSGDTFLDMTNPEYAVISCGKNNDYGHPHSKTLTSLQKRGITVCRTDEDGTVIFSSDKDKITKVK